MNIQPWTGFIKIHNDMIQRKKCSEFQKTGLLLFINQVLHAFGWVIVVETMGNDTQIMYPARTKYRGFDAESVSDSYRKIAMYIGENHKTLIDESKL